MNGALTTKSNLNSNVATEFSSLRVLEDPYQRETLSSSDVEFCVVMPALTTLMRLGMMAQRGAHVHKSKRQMSVKRPISPLDESFVERNEATNNNALQKLHSFGKLFEASILVEFIARHSQIPPFPSYTNLIIGLVNKDHVEEGKLQRPSKLRVGFKHCGLIRAREVLNNLAVKGYYHDTITYNLLSNNTCKERYDYEKTSRDPNLPSPSLYTKGKGEK
ncbi:hypothetical protein Cgig2_000027 [Carnegiea gigantea]|uniref:Uncharacterized protein n=1 Tax=Carnegiea gigantea TaxID=171969 RepID=A0A9Q1KZK3_9CARY|nr:hypothetical protein Cgig2_000027 [Carnegiea gigantea]